jgi:hypothetical protein
VRWISLALVIGLVACGPRRGQEEKRSTYGPPKNSQEAALRWPGEKIEIRSARGEVQLRLRRRASRVRVFGERVVPVGSVRARGDGYVVTSDDGTRRYRVEPTGTAGAEDRWTVCESAGEGEPCAEVAWLVAGESLQLRGKGGASTARISPAGVSLVSGDKRYLVERSGPRRFLVKEGSDDRAYLTGAESPLSAAPLMTLDLSPLVRAALVLVIEDHHGNWSLKP